MTESGDIEEANEDSFTVSELVSKPRKSEISIDNGETSSKCTSRTLNSNSSSKGQVSVSMTIASEKKLRETLEILDEDDTQNELKKTRCFGSCCDLRRACIILNSIYFAFVVFGITMYSLGMDLGKIGGTTDDNIFQNDDAFEDASEVTFGIDDMLKTSPIQLGLGIFFAILGIIGACRFNKFLVVGLAIWLCIDAIIYCVFLNWYNAVIVVVVYSYPNFALFLALKNGKISRDNYDSVRYCCC